MDILTESSGEEARAAALVERFSEAREMSHSLLVLDDVDQIVAGSGKGGYSSVMLSTLRALMRTPPPSGDVARAGGQSKSLGGKTLHIIGTTSRSDAACTTLNEIFDETIGEIRRLINLLSMCSEPVSLLCHIFCSILVVPLLSDVKSVDKLLTDCLSCHVEDSYALSEALINRLGAVGCKTALRLTERAVFTSGIQENTSLNDMKSAQLAALDSILDDLAGDEAVAARVCEVL